MNLTRFIIAGHPRTGSTFLHSLLDSHPQVKIYGEIFHPVDEIRCQMLEGFKLPYLAASGDAVAFLKNHVFPESCRSFPVRGFKLFYLHARSPEWRPLREHLKNTGVKVIHLKRRNRLDRFLSHKLADLTHFWVSYQPSRSGETPRLRLDPKECFKDFHQTIDLEEETDHYFASNPKLDVVYEELVSRLDDETSRVQDFLGLPVRPLSADTQKQRRRRKQDIIENFAELQEALRQGIDAGWAKPEWQEFFQD